MPELENDKIILELKNISFSYGDEKVLNDLTIDIHRGDYLGIIGPNGGGKSTLIKIMLGLLKPNGQVKLFDKDIADFKDWSKIGYVSQQVTHIDSSFPMSVEGVVSMGRYGKKGLFHFLDANDRAIVTRALKQVEMEEYADRLIGDLSGGQQQRVFIARALAGEPEMIILDEPTTGVDAKTQEQLYAFLRKLNHEMHLTLVLASHDLETIEREASELICINRSLVYCGMAKEFRAHESFASFYQNNDKFVHH
jgi:zinc transport system ATP-binding protein